MHRRTRPPRRTGMLLVALVAFTASACGDPPPSVAIDGSSTVFPITEAIAEEFQRAGERVRVSVGVSGTGGGFSKFCNGETDVTNASRPIKESEVEACVANGIEWIELEVATDALAVVVHPHNEWVTGDCLTVEQLHAAWRSGSTVRRWEDLDPAWPDTQIRFYSPGHDSGTFDYFTETINGATGDSRTQGVFFSEDDNVLVQGVAEDRNAFAYFGFAYYQENAARLKALSVDGGDGCVSPTPEAVAAEEYRPLSRPLYVYVRRQSLRRDEVRDFMAFYLAHVDDILPETGYLPLPADEAAEQRRRIGEVIGA